MRLVGDEDHRHTDIAANILHRREAARCIAESEFRHHQVRMLLANDAPQHRRVGCDAADAVAEAADCLDNSADVNDLQESAGGAIKSVWRSFS
jgi:hypothetical protein